MDTKHSRAPDTAPPNPVCDTQRSNGRTESGCYTQALADLRRSASLEATAPAAVHARPHSGLRTYDVYELVSQLADELLTRSMFALERDATEESRCHMRAAVDLVQARKQLRELLELENFLRLGESVDPSDYERPPKPAGRVPDAQHSAVTLGAPVAEGLAGDTTTSRPGGTS